MVSLTRRTALRTGAAAALAGLAGCSGGIGGSASASTTVYGDWTPEREGRARSPAASRCGRWSPPTWPRPATRSATATT
ncbi:hypothetical protein [Halolamina rubra]|uniref:hypothetical protein n=1 Tax=Halolamina rubra TaxID=1380430 RepID=UPI001376E08E|nr:hypothetical protein [Halolamina rubra]